jgi:hypothetical protein
MATNWTTGRSRFDSWQRRKDFFSNLCVQTGLQPPVQWVPWVISLGLKRGRGVTLLTPHILPSSRMSRSYTSSPPLRLHRCTAGHECSSIQQLREINRGHHSGTMFRVVFWDILPCKMIVDRRFRGAYCLHHHVIQVPSPSVFQTLSVLRNSFHNLLTL